MFSFSHFWLPCILMGTGIAIDVLIVTLSKFRNTTLSLKTWTLPITFTHLCFPAIGYYLFWGLSEMFPSLRLSIGLTGFLLVSLVVYEIIWEAIGLTPWFSISSFTSQVFGITEDDSRHAMAIMAVSWDALWSGPAISAQAITEGWTAAEVFLSFFIAGLVVTLIAQGALGIALHLRTIRFHNEAKLARFDIWGKYFELSVISGFGTLSLAHGIGASLNLYEAIGLSAACLAPVFSIFYTEIYNHELAAAKKNIEL